MRRYILVINYAPESLLRLFGELRQKGTAYRDMDLLILTPKVDDYTDLGENIEIIECDFGDELSIQNALTPYRDMICAVLCRGDKYIQDLRRVIPYLSKTVLVSTPESLASATNKRLMRADFMQHFPDITPHFTEVHDSSTHTIQYIEDTLDYPVIVKPASLASSLLIQSCRDRSQLQAALTMVFTEIANIYRREDRRDAPQVIVEEFLEGDFYSIDAYVMQPGEVYFCPPVEYIPANKLGIDDFFLYKRFVPVALSEEETKQANEATARAIAAVGLSHTSVHVELVNTANGWKIIELGPRLGRFRTAMYRYGYGIDHSYNDLLIHMGKKPHVSNTLKQHCAAYSIYPRQEGTLKEISGIAKIQQHPLTRYCVVAAQPGDMCRFAKNGGHALAEFVVASKNRAEFEAVQAFIEAHVEAIIA